MSDRTTGDTSINGLAETHAKHTYEVYARTALANGLSVPAWDQIGHNLQDAWMCASAELIRITIAEIFKHQSGT